PTRPAGSLPPRRPRGLGRRTARSGKPRLRRTSHCCGAATGTSVTRSVGQGWANLTADRSRPAAGGGRQGVTMAYKRGDRWVGFYRDATGKQHTKQFDRKRDADLWEQQQKAAIRSDTWVDPRRSRMTVGEWSEPWMAGRVHLKPKTQSSYRSLLATR